MPIVPTWINPKTGNLYKRPGRSKGLKQSTKRKAAAKKAGTTKKRPTRKR